MKKIILSIIGCAVLFSCTKLENPNKVPDISNIVTIKYKNNDSVLYADGTDRIEIQAILNEDNVGANRTVTFVTEQGSFVGGGAGSKTISIKAEDHVAKVILVADDVANDKMQLTVTVGDFIAYPTVKFLRSAPEEILLSPSKFNLTPDLSDRVYFTVDLKKSSGFASKGTKVDFQVQTLTGNPSLFIQPVYWNETALNRAELISTTTNTGSVRVTAKVLDNGNYVLSEDTISINVQ